MIHKDEYENLIGMGEDTAFDILKFIFNGKYIIDRQVKISTIFEIYSPKNYPKPSKEHLRSSIDIMMTKNVLDRFENKKFIRAKKIAIRIQGKGHTGEHKSKTDRVQKEMLEDWGFVVIDIHIRDAPNLFKERLNPDSVLELCYPLVKSGIKF